MLRVGDLTKHGTVTAVMWIGERYYSMEQGGIVALVPAVIAEEEGRLDPVKCVRVTQP